jgi:hypothetical protein
MQSENGRQIYSLARSRKITSLYHFSPIANLASILKHGLLSRADLAQADLPFLRTDSRRLDRQSSAISVSIHSIQRRMFARLLSETSAPFVIFEVEAAVLWTHPCHFCWVNASSSEIIHHSGFIGGPWALNRMFADQPLGDVDGRTYREAQARHDNQPTNNDAEVQVFAPIGPELIRDLTVRSESHRRAAQKIALTVGRDLPIVVNGEAFALQ